MARFLNSCILITFAYTFVLYYDSSIPGIGYSLKSFISDGNNRPCKPNWSRCDSLHAAINRRKSTEVRPGMAMFTAPYMMVAYLINQISLAVLAALISVIIAYGEIAAAIIGLLGPIFIPFLVIEKLEFLFWGWLKAFLKLPFRQGNCGSDNEQFPVISSWPIARISLTSRIPSRCCKTSLSSSCLWS